MEKSVFYTKGERGEMVKRMNQIHTITLYCPLMDQGVCVLFQLMGEFLSGYNTRGEFVWKRVPTIDAFNVFLYTSTHCKKNNINLDVMSIIAGTLKTFSKLKYINFEFTENIETYNTYLKLEKKPFPDDIEKDVVFEMNTIEMNLTDMFSQDIIDMLNKVMMSNEILPNSYLNRKFKIDFKFDEYISFMDMFLGNNGPMLNQLDKNICDYLRTFPELVVKQKPDIRIITNYGEL